MKKFVIGVIVGAAIATTGSVFASDMISGTYADFKLMVNGKSTQLESKPVVIDGSSYLPVRAVSGALGYDVQFQDGTISLANDGKKYLTESDKKGEDMAKIKETTTANSIKDLKGTYSKDGKLNLDLIKAAIESKGLQLDSQDETTGNSLVFYAIIENNYPVFDYLAKGGANLVLQNKEGKTPLHMAVIEKSRFYMGELRTTYRVKTQIKDKNGLMPIDYTEKGSDEYYGLRGLE